MRILLSPLPLLALLAISSASLSAAATDGTWIGGSGTDWLTAGNWQGSTLPSTGGNATFNSNTNIDVTMDGLTVGLDRMDFNGLTGVYTFSLTNGSNLSLTGAGITGTSSRVTTFDIGDNSTFQFLNSSTASGVVAQLTGANSTFIISDNSIVAGRNTDNAASRWYTSGTDSKVIVNGSASVTMVPRIFVNGTNSSFTVGENAILSAGNYIYVNGTNSSLVITDNANATVGGRLYANGSNSSIVIGGNATLKIDNALPATAANAYLYIIGDNASLHITDNAVFDDVSGSARIFLNGTNVGNTSFIVDGNATVYLRNQVNSNGTDSIVKIAGNATFNMETGNYINVGTNGANSTFLLTENATLNLKVNNSRVTMDGTDVVANINGSSTVNMGHSGAYLSSNGNNTIMFISEDAKINGLGITNNHIRITGANPSAIVASGNAVLDNLTVLVDGTNNTFSAQGNADLSTARVLLDNGGVFHIGLTDPNYVLGNVTANTSGGTILLEGGRNLIVNTDTNYSNGNYSNISFTQQNGNASLTVNGSGKLVLNQANDISALSVASGATIEVGHADALSSTMLTLLGSLNATGADPLGLASLSGNGTINTNTTDLHIGLNDNSTTFNGTLTGTGNIVKTGNGTLTFDTVTATSYTGDIEITLGTLILKDTILNDASSLVLNGGALVTQGSSTIGTLGLKDGTTYSVGASRVGDSSILTPTNTLSANMINIDPTAQIYVDFNGTRAGDTINAFISANKVVYDPSGNAIDIDPNDPATTEKLAEIVVLTPIPTTIGFVLGASANASLIDLNLEAVQLSFSDPRFGFTLNPNQTAIANSLDSLAATDASASMVDAMNVQAAVMIPQILDLINPAGLSSMGKMARQQTNSEINVISQRLDAQRQNTRLNREVRDSIIRISSSQMNLQIPSSQLLVSSSPTPPAGTKPLSLEADNPSTQIPWSAYASGSASMGSIDSSSRERSNGYDYKMAGLTIGMDRYIGANEGIAGLQLSYHHGKSDLDNSGGNTTVDSLRIAGYAGWNTMKKYWIQLHAAVAYHDYETSRLTYNGGNLFDLQTAYAEGSTNGYGFAASAEIGKALDLGSNAKWNAGPFARLTYDWIRIDSFTETNALSSLTVSSQTPDSLRSALGWKFWRDYVSEKGTTWIINGYVAWSHEYQKPNPAISARFTDGGSSFRVHGTDVSRDSITMTLGFQTYFKSGTAVGLNYRGELNSDYDEHSLNAFLSIPF